MNKHRIAIISDLHSNLEAILAVLEDAQKEGVHEIYCLGDVIGYGPNPHEVLSLAEKFAFTILGNHDEAVLNGKGLESFNPIASEAALWTREAISHPAVSEELSAKNKLSLQSMKRRLKKDRLLFAHGSATSNTEYIMDHYDTLESFTYMKQNYITACFVGHTHRPGIFIEGNDIMVPFDAEKSFAIKENNKMVINVGSVGQSRDYNWRSCYVIIDSDRFYYRRVEYDVNKTQQKIYNIGRLDNYLGDRLTN